MIKRSENLYTMVDNDIIVSKSISFSAKGLFAYMCTFDEDFVFDNEKISKEFGVSVAELDKLCNELISAGGLNRIS